MLRYSAYQMEEWERWRQRANTARKTKGITLEDIADHMDLTAGQVSHWFRGRRQIWLQEFVKLCQYILEDPCEILTGVKGTTAPTQAQVDTAVAKYLSVQPHTNPDHGKFMKKLRKDRKRRGKPARRRSTKHPAP